MPLSPFVSTPQQLHVPGLPVGPLAHGLVAAWDFTTGSLTDLMRGVRLTMSAIGAFNCSDGAQGLGLTAGTDFPAASVLCPSHLKLTLPFSLVFHGSIGAATENGGMIFGVTYDTGVNGEVNPSFDIRTASALRNIWVEIREGTGTPVGDITLGNLNEYGATRVSTVAVRFTATSRTAYWNGRLAGRTTGTFSTPAYTSDAEVRVVDCADATCEYALLYNRGLTNDEMAELTGENPWGWKGYGVNPGFWQAGTTEVAPEIAQSFGPLVWVEWEGSDDTIRVWAPVDLPDPSTYYQGYKSPHLLSAGKVVRALSDEQGEYQGQTFEITVNDTNRDIRTLLGVSDNRRHLLNTRLVMRMISQADWRLRRVPRTVAIGKLRNYRLH